MIDLGRAPRGRCLLVWAGVTVTAAALLGVLTPGALAGGTGFADLLVRGCTAALVCCTAWAWLVTSTVVLEAWRGHDSGTPAPRGVPGGLRRLVLRACGLALAGVAVSTASPALATPDSLQQGSAVNATIRGDPLVGLPLPDRAAGGGAPHPRPVTVTVAPGDTLWDLAARQLRAHHDGHPGAGPSEQAVAAYWPQVHRANRAVVGADPDLLRPGQRLRLPAPPEAR